MWPEKSFTTPTHWMAYISERAAACFVQSWAVMGRIGLAIGAVVLVTGCNPAETVNDKVAAAHARNDGPAIWVAKDADSTLYLYGTVHLLPTDLDWQKPDMQEAFASAGTVFFEVPSDEAAQLEGSVLTSSLGFYEDGQRLSEPFDGYQLKLLEAAAHNGGVLVASLDSMKPWLASEFLTIAAAAQAGLSSEISADEALKHRARRLKKNIEFLEDVDSQIRASADLPVTVQMSVLTETLIRFNTLGDDLQRIVRAWSVGHADSLKTDVIENVKTTSPELYQSLFVDRNARWGETLTRYMEGSGTGFVAVGIGHLLGEDSLQAYLRAQGYKVTRYYAFQGEDVIKPIFPKE